MKLSKSAAVLALPFAFSAFLSAEEADKASVWKISDADSTVFLAGSVHLLREKDLPIPEVFDRVYAEVDELVFEVDMGEMTRPETALEMRRLGALPEGEALKDRFKPETMERLRAYLKELGLPEGTFDSVNPGMVFMMFSSMEALRQGARPDLGLEMVFYTKSTGDGKPSRGLETLAYQISLFTGLKDSDVEEWIHRSLDERDQAGEIFDALLAAWRKGDEKALVAEIEKDASLWGPLREVLLTQRNRNWIPEIEKALATDRDVMFLVGAAHLVGEGSVVELLREKGLEVTQLEGRKGTE